MNSEIYVQRVKEALKKVLKKQGLHYEDVAKAFDVSLPTVKRWLNEDDISFERLVRLAGWLGLSLEDLLQVAGRNTPTTRQFSRDQEIFLVTHPEHLLIFTLLLRGSRENELGKESGLSPQRVKRCLDDMDREGFLESVSLASRSTVRRLLRGPFSWRKGGDLERAFSDRIADHIFAQVRQDCKKQMSKDTDETVYLPFDHFLNEEQFADFRKEFLELLKKHAGISHTQMAAGRRKETHSYFGFLAVKRCELWKEIL